MILLACSSPSSSFDPKKAEKAGDNWVPFAHNIDIVRYKWNRETSLKSIHMMVLFPMEGLREGELALVLAALRDEIDKNVGDLLACTKR